MARKTKKQTAEEREEVFNAFVAEAGLVRSEQTITVQALRERMPGASKQSSVIGGSGDDKGDTVPVELVVYVGRKRLRHAGEGE